MDNPVVAGHGVAGIITRSDLQKPPVRAVIFGLLSLMEIHMDFWIQHHCPNDGWREFLRSDRLSQAEKLHAHRESRNEVISLLDCLQLCDKAKIIAMLPTASVTLGFASKTAAESTLGKVERLRNRVAHSQDLVSGETWEKVSKVLRAVETILEKSDQAVEQLRGDLPPPTFHMTF